MNTQKKNEGYDIMIDIDDIVQESEINVIDAISNSLYKEYQILSYEINSGYFQEAVNIKNGLNKALNLLKKIWSFIVNIFKRIINKIKSLFKRNSKTADQIAEEVGLKPSTDAQSKKVKFGKKQIEFVVKNFIFGIKSKDTIYINHLNDVVRRQTFDGAKIKIVRSIDMGVGLIRTINDTESPLKQFQEVIDDFTHGLDGEISLNDRIIFMNKLDAIKRELSDLFDNTHNDHDINLSDLHTAQAAISDISVKINTLTDKMLQHDVGLGTILNRIVDLSTNIQMSLNHLCQGIGVAMRLDARYIGTCDDLDVLAKFTKACIQSGMPPINVVQNTWLVSSSDICGSEQHDIFNGKTGQSRLVMYPEDDSIVYKVAMSGSGKASNDNEVRVSELFADDGESSLVALVVDRFFENYVISMQRMTDESADDATVYMFRSKLSDRLARDKGISHFKLTDIHKGNVKYDKNHVAKCIDYGYIGF